ncbi:ATP-binding cassette domain-containing protein [Tropicimonas sp. TH_r6]|uniref:ABC transporter ATP-binding protein n=1 Tax=Tropicimonas sp. TH_r6 TaxID=3082085 RepID=UPI002953D893|nr:ATP-binding cassette domain-containing protein [Tropicimonas sp. TH_r6]MDV7143186.1 ATP-binding cassette domain-containing protein [Tropicimonas sp. TH_r6]
MTGTGADFVLSAEGLGFDRGDRPILDSVSLCLRRGEVLAVMGPSGCGKSSLLALIVGLLQPNRGMLQCDGQRPTLMFQEPRLLPWRTALDNVAFALKGDGVPAETRSGRARDMLETLALAPEDLGKFPRQLSGGMRQRVALARTLVGRPDLLLLDEPFAALDMGLAKDMRAVLREYLERQNASAVIVTHDPREALQMAGRVVVLSKAPGRVVFEFAPEPAGSRASLGDGIGRLEAALIEAGTA